MTRSRLPSLSGRRGDDDGEELDTVRREITARELVTEFRLKVQTLEIRLSDLEEWRDERQRHEIESAKTSLEQLREREKRREEEVSKAAAADAKARLDAEEAARKEEQRRTYENRRAIGLALLGAVLGLGAAIAGAWAKAALGW